MSAHPGLSAQYHQVTTDGERPAERFEFWRSTCLKLVEPTGLPDGGYDRFRARSQRLAGSLGSFIDNSVTPMKVQRTQLLCARDGIDDLAISLEIGTGGVGWVGDNGNSIIFAPGDLHVLDFGQPLRADWNDGNHRGLLLTLPRGSVFAALGRQSRDMKGVVLPPRGIAHLLASQMRALADLLPSLNLTTRAIALQATIDLAFSVLCLDLGQMKAESDECEDGIFAAALCFINRNFMSERLSPGIIAARLGCSRAHLYRLFARRDLTVTGYIREVRLQRCRLALEAASASRSTIGDIAFRCGFTNQTHFARLFAQRFGMRPRDARMAAARRDPPSVTRSGRAAFLVGARPPEADVRPVLALPTRSRTVR